MLNEPLLSNTERDEDIINSLQTMQSSQSNMRSIRSPSLAEEWADSPTLGKTFSTETRTIRYSRDFQDNVLNPREDVPVCDERKLEIAAVYIRDAISQRQHQTSIANPSKYVEKDMFGMDPLRAYKMVHDSYWSSYVFLSVFVLWSLVLWETRYVGEVTCYIIELIIMLSFGFDVYLRAVAHDATGEGIFASVVTCAGWRKKIVISLLIVLTLIDMTIALALPEKKYYRFTPFFRPYFLVYKSRDLRIMISSILVSIPSVLGVMAFTGIFTLIFSIIGFSLFSEDTFAIGNNPNFKTLWDSFKALVVLLTTSNFPDVMMPSYHESYYSVFFFMIFIVLGIFFLMPLILAVIYNYFSKNNQEKFSDIFVRRGQALDAAFRMASDYPRELQKVSRKSCRTTIDVIQERIYLRSWRGLFKILRPRLPPFQVDTIYLTLSGATKVEDVGITRKLFRQFLDFLFVNIELDPVVEQKRSLKDRYKGVFATYLYKKTCLFRYNLLKILLRREYMWFSDAMVVAGSMTIIMTVVHESDVYEDLSYFFLVFFFVELCYRYFAYGNRLFYSWFECFDASVVVTTFVLSFLVTYYFHVLTERGAAGFIVLRSFRLLKLSRTSSTFKVIIQTAQTVLSSFIMIVALLFCVYYVFGLLGFYLFEGVVTLDNCNQQLQKATEAYNNDLDNEVKAAEASFWSTIVANYYYDNNMNNFARAVVVLMELTVVNNWHVITQMYVDLTSQYTILYFWAFFCCAVLVVVNVLIAFILDAFILQIELNDKKKEEKEDQQQKRLFAAMEMIMFDFAKEDWVIQKGATKALFYEQIFGDEEMSMKLRMTPIEEIVAWKVEEVQAWFSKLDVQFNKYLPLLQKKEVNGRKLVKLTDSELKAMGITGSVERERILIAIKDLIKTADRDTEFIFAIHSGRKETQVLTANEFGEHASVLEQFNSAGTKIRFPGTSIIDRDLQKDLFVRRESPYTQNATDSPSSTQRQKLQVTKEEYFAKDDDEMQEIIISPMEEADNLENDYDYANDDGQITPTTRGRGVSGGGDMPDALDSEVMME